MPVMCAQATPIGLPTTYWWVCFIHKCSFQATTSIITFDILGCNCRQLCQPTGCIRVLVGLHPERYQYQWQSCDEIRHSQSRQHAPRLNGFTKINSTSLANHSVSYFLAIQPPVFIWIRFNAIDLIECLCVCVCVCVVAATSSDTPPLRQKHSGLFGTSKTTWTTFWRIYRSTMIAAMNFWSNLKHFRIVEWTILYFSWQQ